jgi:hypothetical protein
MSRMNKVLMACVALLISASVVMAIPTSDGSLFTDDFSSGDTSKWKRVEGLAGYDGSLGNPAGSFNVSTGTPTEGFGRPNMYWANHGETEWVSEFDVKLSETSSSGDGFLIYAAYAPTFSAAIDIEIGIAANDYVWNYYGAGQNAWDFRVIDATGGQSVVARLRADQWHHFTIHRVVATGVVDLYVDGNYVDSYTAMNSGEILGEVQIGDVTGGGMWGVVNWDNFSIGAPVPEPATMVILLSGTVFAIRRKK